MSMKPSEVHPDHEAPTPETIDDWSEEQLEEWRHAQEQDLQESAREQQSKHDAETEEALALLGQDDDETATVDITDDITVTVRTYFNSDIEDKLVAVDNHHENPSRVRSEMVDVMAWLIQDEKWGDRELWQAYADRYGIIPFTERFFTVVEPALDRAENLDTATTFRGER